MKYYLFLDESGDQNLANFNPNFPVFTLCGIVISEESYKIMENRILKLKQRFWKNNDVILHSRDIRKYEKGFQILFDVDVKKLFYEDINLIMTESDYTIMACSILKEPYIRKYGRLNDVYGLSLSYIMERVIFYLDNQKRYDIELYTIAEKREREERRCCFAQLLQQGVGQGYILC